MKKIKNSCMIMLMCFAFTAISNNGNIYIR
jgi:hypothetical protein